MRTRVVAVETLDRLAVDDPAAMRSRRDLRRLHRAMGTRAILLQALRGLTALRHAKAPLRVLELGAGDGSLMLGVARAIAPEWPAVELTLLDRQPLLESATVARYAALGWTAVPQVIDVLDWAANTPERALASGAPAHWDLIVSNLFLHHFEGAPLAALLDAMAARGAHLVACEPRRGWVALLGSHLVGLIGANAVTRQDAVLSVRAGFRDKELVTLWPTQAHPWQLQEYRAGLFSHCFRAERLEAP